MASLTQRNGLFSVRFISHDGSRKTLALETSSERQATASKLKLEDLVAARKRGRTPDPEVLDWLAKLKPAVFRKLVRFGLVDDPGGQLEAAAVTLGEFLTTYFDKRSDVKPGTRIAWEKPRRNLLKLKFFGADKPLAEITAGDAQDFERYLKTSARLMAYGDADEASGLKPDAVRRRIGLCKQFFHDAVARELIDKNPFAGLKAAVKGNRDRDFFVTREMARKVLEACPDAQWRLIFALSRYGGLRCPSEHLALRLDDVDWELERITVHSPKTEHHEGGASRIIPLFPELRPHLEAVWHAAPPGEKYFITCYRHRNQNLRTRLFKIIRRAGLTPWPKLFHNLRASRQTELMEALPNHVVNKWIGNSREVAERHYLQVTDDHFRRALQICARDATQTVANEKSEVAKPAENRDVSLYLARGVGAEGLEPPTPCL